ncbi:MAG TPA: FAD-dependent oxidoreductase [Terriglobales bacterium]|nr:FAD-dependent oxidoreductase [Terriglobales bacterium]
MKTVYVVGAGPAGLFAAQKIAAAGHQVVIFNRDIKPGGLAEYGIYPVKDKMKVGLRKQFAKVLSLPNVHYFGHVRVGNGYSITIEDLRDFQPAAMVFAVGAQGTKDLNLPGEDCRRVYSAKDFVYHYNQLPPFASQDFSTGKRIAIVGMGNVMVDIARWVLQDDPDRLTEELIVVARRGPFEAKFDEREFVHIEQHLDRQDFQQELERIQPCLAAVGQDIANVAGKTFPILAKPYEPVRPRLKFRFLYSPVSIHAGASGCIDRLTVRENILVERDGSLSAKGTDRTADLDVDTMIFAIGDSADPNVGLPYGAEGYVTRPGAADPGHPRYEIFDPQSQSVVAGTFAVGWARKASEGLVGIARHDGEVGAATVLQYLEAISETAAATPEEIYRYLTRRGIPAVSKEDLHYLSLAEEREATSRGLQYFKYSGNDSMLAAIEEERRKAGSVVTG